MLQRLAKLESRLDTILPTLATKGDLQEIKATIAESKYDLVKTLVPIFIAAISVAVAVLLFALNRLVVPASSPVPIVIQVPSSSPTGIPPTK
jgi:hypothetical protein